MVDIVTRLGKGSPLTNAEVDANFTNLAEVSGVTGEPMGHEDRTTSTISFNASTRTFTIAPVASSFTVWCKGKKVVVSTAQTVTIPNTTGMYSIYYDANGVLSAKSGYFTFSLEAPTAYVYWNAATGTAPYFGDERHGVVLDWQTHEYLHRTRGAALASGFSASGYVLGGNGSSNSHAQITLEGGTFFDEDMKIIVTATNTPTAGTWEQDLLSPARIPVLYLSGTGWVIDSPTDYPLKQGTSRPQYNAYSGGVWSTADVANNKYATSWILATNNLTYPVIAIIGQAENDLQSAAEAVDFTALQLPGFPSVEFRPLYKLIFQCADSCTNAVHASLVSITDIRSIAAAGTAASIVTDHGNLSGLSDDDHPQYIHVDTLRTVSAAVKASFLPSQTSNAGKFLQTDGTATSWQALTSGNVTTALGFTPYNATNPSGYISGITSGMVTTALGFTPYNATNPSGYVTAAGARGAISVTGAGSYDSATGVINIVGGVTSFNTRTGAITLSSADVTTALGFTPYNNTNPSGYITGITSTMVTTALGFTPYNSSNPNGYISSITSANVTTALGFTPYNATNPSGYITNSALSGYLTSASAASTYLPLSGGTVTGTTYINTGGGYPLQLSSSQRYMLQLRNTGNSINSGYGWWFATDTNFNFAMHADGLGDVLTLTRSGALTLNGNTVLHAGNYNSYAPTLTGGGASGTWGISVTGNAATAGGLAVHDTQGTQNSANQIVRTQVNGYTMLGWINTTSGDSGIENRLTRIYSSNDGYVRYSTLTDFKVHMGLSAKNSYSRRIDYTSDANYHVGSMGHSGYGANETFHGGSGFFDIWSGTNYPPSTSHIHGFNALHYTTNSLGSTGGNAYGIQVAGQYDQGGLLFSRGCSGGSFSSWRRQIDDNNYNSYSPTLTGGNASGTWGINITGNARALDSGHYIYRTGTSGNLNTDFTNIPAGTMRHAGDDSNVANSPGGTWWFYDHYRHSNSSNFWGTQIAWGWEDNPNRLAQRNVSGGSWSSWVYYLNSGNYSSYALPLSGGTVTGTTAFTRTDDNAISVGTIRGRAVGSQSGDFVHIYERVHIGSPAGWGSRSAPTYGLSTYGGCALATDTGSVTIGGNTALHAGNYTNYVQLPYTGWPGYPGTDANTFLGGSWVRTSFTYSNNAPLTGTIATFPSGGYDLQLNANYNGHDLYFRSRNGDAGSWMSWKRVLTDNNYTSYSPSLTGSGASGTWGISISGSAASLQGYQWGSAGKDIRGADIYADSWLRNYNSNTGLYNQATGNHWYSDGQYWNVGYSGTTGIRLRNGHAGTVLGYLYAETSGNFGLLHNNGGWAVQVNPGGGGTLHSTWTGGNIRANRANGNFYIDDNYGNGVVGVYSSYRYQGVFAMGDSYKLPADGTGLGTLYGMAWSHPNAGGAAGNLSDHGLLIINNGSFRCAISNSIVASNNITAYSDERLKTNWRDMPENFVARLAEVKVGIYDRIDEENTTQVGVGAQSFQKLLPQAIMTAKDEMGTLSVSYGNAALASAVELAKDNVELRARVERLESLINKLIGD